MKIFCSLLLSSLPGGRRVTGARKREASAGKMTRRMEQRKARNNYSGHANNKEYKIGPQDVLRIDVWKEPEITRAVPVRPDGKITLPLLNDIQAAGLTPMELAKVIRDGLKKYINEPASRRQR